MSEIPSLYIGKSFYVGTALANRANALRVINTLQNDFKMKVTYIWDKSDPKEYGSIADTELQAVAAGEIFIGLLPGKLGTQGEIGAALAYKDLMPYRRVLLHAEHERVFTFADFDIGVYPNVFWSHPMVERVVGEDPVFAITSYLKAVTG